MVIDVSKKRSEVILLAITVIVMAFLVGIASNIVFTEFYKDPYKARFTVVIGLSIIMTSLFGYFKILSQAELGSSKTKFLFTFNKSKGFFIDIPHCVTSVNGRLLFNRLPEEKQKEISQYKFQDLRFDDCELLVFLNNIVQEIILTGIVNNSFLSVKGCKKITVSQLPSSMRQNYCLDQSETIYVPQQLNIETFGRFIRLSSMFGNIDFHWKFSLGNQNHWTRSLLSVTNPDDTDEYSDFVAEVTMAYKCNFWPMFSKNLDTFLLWIELIERNLKEYEWADSERQMILFSLKKIASGLKKIENRELS